MKRFWLKCLLATAVTISLTLLTSGIANMRIFQLLFPETVAIKEFEFTDFAFDLTVPQGVNDKITIVNIGELDRAGIADLIEALNSKHPAVIGIDAIFACAAGYDTVSCPQLRDERGNTKLAAAIRNSRSIVLAAHPLRANGAEFDPRADMYDSLQASDRMFSAFATPGHSLLSTTSASDGQVQSCRAFDPRITFADGSHLYAFSVEVARLYDSTAVEHFLKMFNDADDVQINYTGNIVKYGFETDEHLFDAPRHFHALDPEDVLSGGFPEYLVKDRIILLEYLGTSLTAAASEKEKLYTPLNRKKIGRTYPDMYPSVVHANIINMIIAGDYLIVMSALQEFALTFVICFIHVGVLMSFRERFPYLHDLVAVTFVVLIIAFMALFRLIMFTEFNLKSDLTFTIGSLALAGIVVALYNDLLDRRLMKLLEKRASPAMSAEKELSEVGERDT